MLELAESNSMECAATSGVMEDYYEIVAGEAGEAAKITKNQKFLYQELTTDRKLWNFLIENIQREDLNPIEEALAFAASEADRI